MGTVAQLLEQSGLANLGIGNLAMFVVAGVLIYLAIAKGYEPLLLIPIGFGAILANLPLADMGSYGEGIIAHLCRRAPGGICIRFHIARSGFHRHHRRCGRSDLHLSGLAAGTASPGSDRGRRVQLHVAGPHHPATHHSGAHDSR
jgi:hypothetical protein